MAKTYMKLDGDLVPISLGTTIFTSIKEEQTKTVAEQDFSSGDVIVTPDAGTVLRRVTVVKDNNLVPENIVKDVNIFGVVGTAETGGEGDILYHGTGTGSGSGLVYYTVKYEGRIVLLHLNNIAQDFPSIPTAEIRGLFIVNDGTNITTGEGHTYMQSDGSSMGIISNAYMFIFSNGLIILKFDTSFPEE